MNTRDDGGGGQGDGRGTVGWLVTVTWDAYCLDCAPDEAAVRRLSGMGSRWVAVEPLSRGLAAADRAVCLVCGQHLGTVAGQR